MKKIEAIIQPDMLEDVIKGIRKIGVGGLTVLNAQGQGAAEPPLVGQMEKLMISWNLLQILLALEQKVMEKYLSLTSKNQQTFVPKKRAFILCETLVESS